MHKTEAGSLRHLFSDALEGKTDGKPATFRSENADTKNRAPITWGAWVNAFTNLISSADRIALLPHKIASLQWVAGETVDASSACNRSVRAHARRISTSRPSEYDSS